MCRWHATRGLTLTPWRARGTTPRIASTWPPTRVRDDVTNTLREPAAWRRVGVVVATGLCVVLSGPGVPGQAPARPVVRLTTGLPGGAFNPLGIALVDAFRRAIPDWRFEIAASGGAIDNIHALQQRDADLGLAFADVSYMAFTGQDGRRDPFDQLRGVAVLHVTPVHLIVGSSLGVPSIERLKGRRIALGPAGSGTAVTAELLLNAFGLSRADVHGEFMPFLDAAKAVVRGEIDGAFVNAGYPAESVRLATASGAHLLEIAGPAVERLRLAYPFLKVARIPAGTYPLHVRDVHTVSVDAVLLCRADYDEAVVYRLTRGFFDALPALASQLHMLRSMDLDRVAATPIPLHPGAARYYREREIAR